MLIFGGGPEPPDQIGDPCPPVTFALVTLVQSGEEYGMLHKIDCPDLPAHEDLPSLPTFRDVVYSTTYRELFDHVSRQFDDGDWLSCHVCGG